MPTLLVVDDEPGILSFVTAAMTRHGWFVKPAATVKDALAVARTSAVDVALCDVVMPVQGGHEFTSGIRELANGQVPVVLMSAYPLAMESVGGIWWGKPPAFIRKPFRIKELATVLERALPDYA